jgi:hypothetical protein
MEKEQIDKMVEKNITTPIKGGSNRVNRIREYVSQNINTPDLFDTFRWL